ncbi:MAG: GNAT family N-acetyltransferase [Cuniculiplasma sp.]
MLIKRLQAEDLEDLVKLEVRAFEVGPYSLEMLEYALQEAGDMAFKIEESKRIAAYIIASPISDESIDIESVAVDPDFRGKGLAKSLMNYVENMAKEMGFKRMQLEVREFNMEAIGLYKKLGYELKELLKNYYSEKLKGSRNAYRMEKLLA